MQKEFGEAQKAQGNKWKRACQREPKGNNLKRMHKYENLPLYKQLSFYFLASFPFHRKFFSHRNESSAGLMP
jgi:hypothetical protein